MRKNRSYQMVVAAEKAKDETREANVDSFQFAVTD